MCIRDRFKSLNEYHKISQILAKKGDDDLEVFLNVLSRLFFLGYWFFDNLVILCTIKFIRQDSKKYNKLGMTCWAVALLVNLVQFIRQLVNSLNEEVKITSALRSTPRDGELETLRTKLNKIRAARVDIYLNLVKTFGDMIPAVNGTELPLKVFKKSFNDGWIGFGGFVSAVITSHQLY
eukprot:TRINITY_DN2655_c0_g1_i4.p2 TRINITY_DN2655_c0_g1~~TRINITY_DN2655_c0_g1_i4.p2  ORF type:complete len:179 (+),score=52.34 TRINITY_DN2655_c0_g1_i4:85-621(+)